MDILSLNLKQKTKLPSLCFVKLISHKLFKEEQANVQTNVKIFSDRSRIFKTGGGGTNPKGGGDTNLLFGQFLLKTP